jgi:hypothetical protein
MCLMPYHETNYFVRALQMIDLSDTNLANASLWSWLAENQTNGVFLSASTLATHLFSNLSFFSFVSEYLNDVLRLFVDDLNSLSEHQQKIWMNGLNFCLSFLAKLLLQSVEQLHVLRSQSDSRLKKNQQNNKLEESYFALLLPVLFEGFRADILPYKQLAYLVSSFLFERFEFADEITSKALVAISRGLATFRTEDGDTDVMMIVDENTAWVSFRSIALSKEFIEIFFSIITILYNIVNYCQIDKIEFLKKV